MSIKWMWDFWAKYYDSLWVQKYSLTPTRNIIISNINIQNDLRILDVGCGIGELLRDMKNTFKKYSLHLSGIDFSPNMIKRAKEFDSSINYQVLDVSFINNYYENLDYIICTHSFPYYKNKKNIIEKFHSILNTNGTLLLAQASENTFYDKIALFFVKFTTGKAKYPSIKEIQNLTKELFELEKIEIIKEKAYMPSIILFKLKKI